MEVGGVNGNNRVNTHPPPNLMESKQLIGLNSASITSSWDPPDLET